MGHGIRTRENRTRLSVHALAVTEEQALARGVVLVEDASLPHETLVHQRRVADLHTRSDDKIRTLDTAAEPYRSRFVGIDRSVLEAADTGQFGKIADLDILDRTAVEDAYVVADVAMIGSLRLGVLVDAALQLMNHRRAVTVKRQDIRQAGGELIENRNLPSAAFVHHRHANLVAERRLAVHEDGVDVLDTGVVADVIVGDIVMDVIEVRIIAHFAVMQSGVIDARMDLQPTRQSYLPFESSQTVMTGETGVMHVLRVERFRHLYLRPVLRRAALCLQLRDLLSR